MHPSSPSEGHPHKGTAGEPGRQVGGECVRVGEASAAAAEAAAAAAVAVTFTTLGASLAAETVSCQHEGNHKPVTQEAAQFQHCHMHTSAARREQASREAGRWPLPRDQLRRLQGAPERSSSLHESESTEV